MISVVSGASHCRRTGAGGWAAVAYGHRASGRVPGVLVHRDQAALWAVALGLEWLVSLRIPAALESVILATDSIWALQMIRSQLSIPQRPSTYGCVLSSPLSSDPLPEEMEALSVIHLAGRGLSLSVSHQRSGWATQQCQSMSKTEMRRQREYLKSLIRE